MRRAGGDDVGPAVRPAAGLERGAGRTGPGRRLPVRPAGRGGAAPGRTPAHRLDALPTPPRSWSCGCPYADFVRFRANHNSKIAEGWDEVGERLDSGIGSR